MALLKDTIIQGRLNVRDTNIKGSLKASGNISAANATFNDITSHNIVPAANKSYSLGTGDNRYLNIWGGHCNLSGNLVVSGDLTVNGTQTILNTSTISVEDQLIELGKRSSTTAITGYTGMYVQHYDGTNSGALVYDNTGTAYVGDVTISNGTISDGSNLEPIATRVEESTIEDTSLAFWSRKNVNDPYSVLLNTAKGASVGVNAITAPNYTITAKTFKGYLNGTAAWAGKLDILDAGTENLPVFFKNGIPEECSRTLGTETDKMNITGNAATASYASEAGKLSDDKDAGSGINPIYFSKGVPVASSSTVGTTTKPVYLSSGTLTECSEFATKNHDHGNAYVKAKHGDADKDITINWASSFGNSEAPYLLGWNSDGSIIRAMYRNQVAVGSADCSAKVAVSDAGSTSTYNLALLTATGTTACAPVYVTNNHLKYNTGTGDLAAKTMTVGSSKQATMSFNDTNDCIEFIFN